MHGDDDELELNDPVEELPPEEDETPEEETPEAKLTRLESERDAARGEAEQARRERETERNTYAQALEMFKAGSPAAPGDPPPKPMSAQEREDLNARLAVSLGTEPLQILENIRKLAKDDALTEFRKESSPTVAMASESIIDKYERKFREDDPAIGEKVSKLFRKEMDGFSPQQKASLLGMTAEQQEKTLELHWKVATADYLRPLARPRSTGQNGAAARGSSPGERSTPERQSTGFRFTPSQVEAMKRSGIKPETIKAREKNIRDGIEA